MADLSKGLRAHVQVPGMLVLTTFMDIESNLEEVLRTVPFCDEHKSVWSPKLVTVILEACSLFDSLLKFQNDKNDKIEGYFQEFGKLFSIQRVAFYRAVSTRIEPFSAWKGCNTYKPLSWWQSYNCLKHNRIENITEATLENAVEAMAGLFVAILGCPYCRAEIEASSWRSHYTAWDGKHFLTENAQARNLGYLSISTRLFGYPVGWGREALKEQSFWSGPAGPPFTAWFNQNRST